jgi:protocatechuate 3,4-dioxygenase beta subunit
MTPDTHLLTRRRSLVLFGTAGASLLGPDAVAEGHGPVAEGHDYVANAAASCTLTAEQEEGPFYVAVDDVRENIIEAQVGLPLELQITLINSQTCKPLRHAAIDIWHASASGVYSDESSENTVGQTWLRGVQFTDKHGRVTFRTIFPGHYQGRTTHIHLKVHTGATVSGHTTTGGHVAHTGQIFPSDAVNAEVYELSPYSAETTAIVPHSSDMVWTGQHGSGSRLKVSKAGHRLSKGLIASVVLGVNPSATPAAVGVSGAGGPPGA